MGRMHRMGGRGGSLNESEVVYTLLLTGMSEQSIESRDQRSSQKNLEPRPQNLTGFDENPHYFSGKRINTDCFLKIYSIEALSSQMCWISIKTDKHHQIRRRREDKSAGENLCMEQGEGSTSQGFTHYRH